MDRQLLPLWGLRMPQGLQWPCNRDPPVVRRRYGGSTALIYDEPWQHLAATSAPEMLWNICHNLYELRREALEGAKRTIFAAFIEGRLKKSRKRKGHVSVTIEEAP